MNGARLLCKKRAIDAAWVSNTFDHARNRCESSAQRVLRVGRQLAKRRDLNPWTDDEIAADRATRTRLNAKVRVENNIPRGDRVNMCGNHLTRQSSAVASESATGRLLKYSNYKAGGNKPARRRLQRLVRSFCSDNLANSVAQTCAPANDNTHPT